MTLPALRRLVVDACVVAKWQLDDEGETAAALALRDDFLVAQEVELHAPTLLTYELTNVIHNAARKARLEPALAEEALSNLLACPIQLHSPEPLRVLAIARECAVAAYDAAYVAVAEQLGAELITADRPLYRRATKRFRWVRWIGEYLD